MHVSVERQTMYLKKNEYLRVANHLGFWAHTEASQQSKLVTSSEAGQSGPGVVRGTQEQAPPQNLLGRGVRTPQSIYRQRARARQMEAEMNSC